MSSDAELLKHIAKLNSAIQQHRQQQQQHQRPTHNNTYYSSSRGRGRGRGGSNLTLGSRSTVPLTSSSYRPASAFRPAVSHNKSLVLDNTKKSDTNVTTGISNISNNSSGATTTTVSTITTPPGYAPHRRPHPQVTTAHTPYTYASSHQPRPLAQPNVLRPTHNKTLNNTLPKTTTTATNAVTAVSSSPHRSLILNKTVPSSTTLKAATPTRVILARPGRHKKLVIRSNPSSTSSTRPVRRYQSKDGKSIVEIDGVPFIAMGKRLIRQHAASASTSTVPHTLIRRLVKRRDTNKNMVLGKQPLSELAAKAKKKKSQIINRKRGNTVYRRVEGYARQGKHGKSLVLTSQQQQKKTYCGTYTRYGTCPNQGKCPFLHDPNHRAICVKFLFGKPCRSPCRLSHQTSPHNVPHCRHFQRLRCTNDPCPFAHVRVRPDAPLCRFFGVEGYCPKGLACKELHVIVCPTFAVLGKCTKPRCTLPHVASTYKKKSESTTATATTDKEALTAGSSGNNIKSVGKQQWIRPELKAALLQQRQQKQETASTAMDYDTPEVQKEESDDGFVPLFGDDENDDDDTDWNQYLIKDQEDMNEIESLRFREDDEDEADNDQQQQRAQEEEDDEDVEDDEEEEEGAEEGNDDDDEGIVYEEISEDDAMESDGSVEEIYEEVSDMEEDDG